MPAPVSTPRVPLLRNGDHMPRDEFERRYAAMPGVNRAELIDGVVFMPSPVRADEHGGPHADLITWLGHYRAHTPGVRVYDNTSVRLDVKNEPQPDGVLLILPEYGGQATIDAEGYIEGGPELVAEVAASSVSIDRNSKKRAYLANDVREYILWRVEDSALDWFVLRNGQYDLLPVGADGVHRSEVFPGLWLDWAALSRGDLVTVLAVLQQGLSSADHAAFVTRLRQARKP